MTTPEPTRQRYEKFLKDTEGAVTPLIEVFNPPETGETRLMFNSDFASPQLPVLRKMFETTAGAQTGLLGTRPGANPLCLHPSAPFTSGELSRKKEAELVRDLCADLSFAVNRITGLYVYGRLTFNEMLFAGNAIDFTHMFIFKERDNAMDREILASPHQQGPQGRLCRKNPRFQQIHLCLQSHPGSSHPKPRLGEIPLRTPSKNASTRQTKNRIKAMRPLMINTGSSTRSSPPDLLDNWLHCDIFRFMFKLVSCTLKTNFYKLEKRSFAFRFDNAILDPLVFDQFVFGIFFVNGHYACGTHLRAGDIARGGLRLIRVSPSNYPTEIDNAVLLNYALGPKAQRLKHKDICESGSKGVVVPHAIYASHGMDALYDYTEGIIDLVLGDDSIVDYYGRPEMVFFGPTREPRR